MKLVKLIILISTLIIKIKTTFVKKVDPCDMSLCKADTATYNNISSQKSSLTKFKRPFFKCPHSSSQECGLCIPKKDPPTKKEVKKCQYCVFVKGSQALCMDMKTAANNQTAIEAVENERNQYPQPNSNDIPTKNNNNPPFKEEPYKKLGTIIFPDNQDKNENVAFVIDTSGSMKNLINASEGTRLQIVLMEMKRYIKNNPNSNYVIISGDPFKVYPQKDNVCSYTKDFNGLTNHIDSLEVESKDNFSLNPIVEQLIKCKDLQRIEIVTDGGIIGLNDAKGKIDYKDAFINFYLFNTGGKEDALTKAVYLYNAKEFYESIKSDKKMFIKLTDPSKKR